MYNCICRDNGPQNIRQVLPEYGALSGNIYNSNIEGINQDNFSGVFINNINTDPQFVDTANFDFHLKDSSPCINTGTPDTTGLFLPPTDVEGKPRIANGWIDMGAYETPEFSGNQPPLIEKIRDLVITPGSTKSFCLHYIDPDAGDYAFLLEVSSTIPQIKIHHVSEYSNCIKFMIDVNRIWQGSGEIKVVVTDNHGNLGIMRFHVLISHEVCGKMLENTIWDNDTIKVICDVTVSSDAKLTIKPGTVVAFAKNCGINCNGNIVAIGNKNSEITFTSIDTTGFYNKTYEGWKGIRLIGNENAEFRYCSFLFATNENNGGALSDMRGSKPALTITNCTFNHNFSQQNGGAIYRQNTILEFKNNTFIDNRANRFGGAIYFNDKNSDIINSLFINNKALQGAAIYIESEAGSNRLINNTIVMNKAEISGGGICLNDGSIINCIFWGNEAGASAKEIKFRGLGKISKSIIDDGIKGIVFSEYDPSFLREVYFSDPNFTDISALNFHLTDSSAAINTGNFDTTGLFLPLSDLDSNPRIHKGNIDIGAYEFQHASINRNPVILFPSRLYLNIGTLERERVNFVDPDNDYTHTLSITTNSENIQILDVSGDTSGCYFSISPLPNWEGRALLTIRAEDVHGNVAEHNCEIIVGYIVCGEIRENTVWNADTVHVTCDITISKNARLTIMPGTIILFHGYRKLNVAGEINAIGTSSNKIIFTTEDSAGFYFNTNSDNLAENFGWSGLYFKCNWDDTVASVFRNCIFKYASNSMFYAQLYKDIEIENCLFMFSKNPIHSWTAKFLIKNCIFTNNYGTLIFTNSPLIIDSCILRKNIADSHLIYMQSGNQVISNCVFDSNYAIKGACLDFYYDYHGLSRITNNVFDNNKVGSAVAFLYSGVLFDNNLVSRNTCTHYSYISEGATGGVYINGNPVILNNTIVYNSVSNGGGGGLFIRKKSDVSLYNNILYGNRSDGSNNQINSNFYDTDTPVMNILFSDIHGGRDGITGKVNLLQYENNIDTDPLLIADTLSGFTPGFLSLSDLSPCINAGIPDTTGLNLPGIDLEGNPRIFDGRIDMGAYEYQHDNFHILKQPVSQAICKGAAVTLETEAIGGVLGYQWQKNGADIPSANKDTFTIDSVSLNDSGLYNCIIIADDKTVSSDTVILSIPDPGPPSSNDTTICEGQEVPELTASGDQITWYSDAGLSNAVHTGSTFNTGQSAHGHYIYYATQSVSGCESAAGTVTLTIHELPMISLGEDSTISSDQSVVLGPYPGSYSYLWNDDSQNPFLEISGNDLGNGSHAISVVVTDPNACRNSDTMIVIVVPLTNIDLTQNNQRLLIFPNPNSGLFNIDVSEFHDEDIIIKGYNQQGEEILNNKMRVDNKAGNMALNLTSFPPGIYYLQIITNHSKYVGKVVLE